ncbi:copper resistance protein CopD [Bradyrhizobium centrolobii]|uniref:Copper resistance protein CopD n=1 Tax=Bradyrhizobium centrolobii TaxID=1505087 RepID=A0A176YNI3_9BRAD|nr:copper homeostasis membrane protein CopD [Bradyrhizobium centrolobii]OAF07768.1 copper resistance protein CopD [Bradyrhizobium centrolobii]
MIDVGLILARFVHYAATAVLFGVSLFPLYAYANSEPAPSRSWRSRLLLVTAVITAISGPIWFLFAAANMAGSLSDLADAETLWAVVRDTGFGNVWTARMVLAVAIVVATAAYLFRNPSTSGDVLLLILAAVFLASLAGAGHAQVEEGRASVVHVLSDAAHLLAAGAWLGGLVPLAYILASHATTSRDAGLIDQVLLRFSGMGYVAVATLVGTGLVNSCFLVGSVSNLLATPYGQVLLAKLGLFAGMVALAAANRFWLVPAMSNARPDASEQSMSWLRRLRNHVFGEQFLGAMVLLIVSLLGTMKPAIGQ